ncbi:DUF3179 domain-containing protein [Sedimenticola sp.]|uniref:DUF3179 domain-containing protein n=1 Tax=Sedimenticola sp. TaxID=1940285 RepID=UPI003D13C9CF
MPRLLSLYLTLFMLGGLPALALAERIGDFTITPDQSLIPLDEIHSGGPAKDGIPAIDQPRFLTAQAAGHLKPASRILGLHWHGVTKAYPIAIMNWHEIVNDRFGDEPVIITYCPLCGSGVAFSAQIAGETLQFGVSGLLYNSDVLLYDRKTQSLWSQLLARAVTGKMKGTRLKILPLVVTNWAQWRQQYPDTQVLSRETGFLRDYDRDPYTGYESSTGIYFPVKQRDSRYHPKEQIYGLTVAGQHKAYPVAELSRRAGEEIKDQFAGRSFTIRYQRASQSARFYDQQGKEVPVIRAYWFAWYAFHPDTAVFSRDATDADSQRY